MTVESNSTTTCSMKESPVKNGCRCPQCGKKKGYMDVYPNVILTSDPPMKNTRCENCGHVGYRRV